MANYNKVLLMGNLTRDVQLRFLPSQMQVAEFGLAINRRFKTANGEDREEVCFVDCTAWGKTAENINRFFQKGKPIFVEGRLKYDTWEDKQGGGKRSKLGVVVDRFEFIGAKGDAPAGGVYQGSDETSQAPPSRAPARAPVQQAAPPPQQSQQPPPEQPFGEEQQFKEDDIPF